MGGCAMIGQAMINVTNGGSGRSAGIVAGVFTLIIIVAIESVIGVVMFY
jgi:sulfate permease, SulP family